MVLTGRRCSLPYSYWRHQKSVNYRKLCENKNGSMCLFYSKYQIIFVAETKIWTKFNPNMFRVSETGGNCFYWLLHIETCRSHRLTDGPPAEEQNIPQLWVRAEHVHVEISMPNRCTVSQILACLCHSNSNNQIPARMLSLIAKALCVFWYKKLVCRWCWL